MSYRCDDCGREFDEMKVVYPFDRFEMNYMSPPEYVCPYCGSDEWEETELC